MTLTTVAPERYRGSIVERLSVTPVVRAGSIPGYGPIFNAGLIFHDGRFHLFARAVRDTYRRGTIPGGPRFENYVSDVVILESVDGITYTFAYVLAASGDHGVNCYEDPRVQRIHSGTATHIVMTYTNLPADDTSPWRVGAHRLSYDGHRFHVDADSGRVLGPDGIHDKDGIIFNLDDGRVALIHRINPNMQLAIFDDLEQLWDADQGYWTDHVAELEQHAIITPNPGALGIGAGAPPVTTDHGLLLFFHERRADGAYTMNLALLDKHTGRTLAVLPDAIMTPQLGWETHGDVDNVVFVQGAHLDPGSDTIYLVYGAADRHIGAARASASQLLALLQAASGQLAA